MSEELSSVDQARHHELFAEGTALIEGEVLFEGRSSSGKPGLFARRKLQKAIERFHAALEIDPRDWRSMWLLGKIHQRMDSSAECLFWFKKAMALAPGEPDVAREAGLAAFDAGHMDLALQCHQAALNARPNDHGLMANLALAHLLRGDLRAAHRWVTEALVLVPTDPVSARISKVILEVEDGKRPQPTSVDEIH